MLKFKLPDPIALDIEGQTVFVHPLTAGQLAELLGAVEVFKKAGVAHKADFLLLQLSVKDAQGEAVFTSVEDAMNVPPGVAGVLLPACLKINGMGEHDEKKVG